MIVERVHLVVDYCSSGDPISQESLGDEFQEGENINRWSGAELVDSSPFLQKLVKPLDVRSIDGRRTDAVD